jgi:protein involved in polysaccharide export with SLBB domain
MKRLQQAALNSIAALAAAAVILVTGCGTTGSGVGTDPGVATGAPPLVSQSIDEVRVGDRLTISFTDVPQPPPPVEVRVPDSGKISLPMEVTVDAVGKNTSVLAEDIRKKYEPFYKRLTVIVRQDDRFFYVGGAVRKPDRHQYAGQMTLLGAIKAAGDFNDFARKTKVVVTRQDGTRVIVDCKKAQKDSRFDVPIYPNDNIYVPQRTGPL